MGKYHADFHSISDELMKQVHPHMLAAAPHGIAFIDTDGIVRMASAQNSLVTALIRLWT
jgi:hypothetical protein